MTTVLALDAGDICMQEKIKITPDMTDAQLMQIISDKAPFIMYPTLKQLYNKILVPQKQDDSLMTIAKKFKKEDAVIDWSKSAQEIHNHVRSMTTWPVACTNFRDKNIKILKTEVLNTDVHNSYGTITQITQNGLEISTGKGTLLVKELKPEGKPKMDAYAWSNGAKVQVGNNFS